MNIECYFLSVVEHASLHLFVLTHSLPSISMVDGHMLQEETSDRKKKKNRYYSRRLSCSILGSLVFLDCKETIS